MLRIHFVLLALAMVGVNLSAQSIILNGDFETYSSCPSSNGQLNNCSSWSDGVLSSDYMNCSFNGWSTHIGGSYEGTGYVGGASYGLANGAAEGYGTFTSTPMIAGQPYRFRLYAKMSSGGTYSQVCGGACFYGRFTAPPPQTGIHPANVAGSTLLGCTPTVSNTTWAVFQTTITPTANYTYIQLTEGTEITSANCRQYIYIDSFSVVTTSVLDASDIRFLAEKTEDGVLINWSVPQELATTRYEVERKGETGDFEIIASRAANGSEDYNFLDASELGSKTLFYRIREVSADGSASLSPVLAVKPQLPEGFSASVNPNPFQGNGTLQLNVPAEGRVEWRVYNSAGKMVKQGVETTSAGSRSLDLEMAGELPGIHFLKVNFQDQEIHSKIVLQN